MFEQILENIATVLAAQNIPYMIIGGQAVLLYGEPRLTRDIDITLGMGIEKLPQLLEAAKQAKLQPLPANPSDFVGKAWVLPCEEPQSKIRVDFIFSFTPYEQNAIGRAKNITIGKSQVKFAAPEDIIIHKLFAGRGRDIDDAVSILEKNEKLDAPYIKKWLMQFEEVSPEKNLIKTFENCLEQAK
jgi:predicted nucleotidyltransferase